MARTSINRFVASAFAALAIVGSSSLAAPALTSSNTVGAASAGEGAGAVSGVLVSDIDYELGADPTLFERVGFTVDRSLGVAAEITVRLDSTSTNWYPCRVTGRAVSCDLGSPPIAVGDADELRVIAVD